MNLIVKAGCRIFQKAFRFVIPVLPYREPKIVDACDDLKEVFEKEKITSLLIVTDQGIIDHGLLQHVEEACKKYCVEYTIYSGVKPNPTVENVECGLHLYQNNQSQAIIAIGGGFFYGLWKSHWCMYRKSKKESERYERNLTCHS